MAGGGTPGWHMDALRARQAYGKNWKKRKGGMDPDLWMSLSKDSKKDWAGRGLGGGWVEGSLGDSGHWGKGSKNNLWEQAAWEMGMGNIKDKDDLKKLKDRYEELGIKDFDSMSDVSQFRKSNDDKIDELVQARFDEWTKNQQTQQGGQQANGPSGMEPQVVPGADGYRSQFSDWITSIMGSSPYTQWGQGPQTQQYTPKGGW